MKSMGMFFRAVKAILAARGQTWKDLAAAVGVTPLTLRTRMAGAVTPEWLDKVGAALGHTGAWLLSQAWMAYRREREAGGNPPMPLMRGDYTPAEPGKGE